MSPQALYRRWRSQRFAELVGQEHVTTTLRNAVATGRIAHAYLFCGPRGTGKTSTARILAKAVNCLNPLAGEPCDDCAICRSIAEGRALDLIEIDAASNRGIDEIRDLREKVRFAPNEAHYKVYIVDEVHMLTEPAFNALLKTLEEPPARTIFILATTESHKVPATIISRCQRFDFRRIPLGAAVDRLALICEREGIAADRPALELLTKASTGSLRDAENLLDQLVVYYGAEIDVDKVEALLGISRDARVGDVARAFVAGDVASGLRTINAVVEDGGSLRQFNRDLIEYLRGVMLVAAGAEASLDVPAERLADLRDLAGRASVPTVVGAIRLLGEADGRLDGGSPLPLELAFVEAALGAPSASTSAAGTAVTAPAPPAPSAAAPARRAAPPAAPAPTSVAGAPPGPVGAHRDAPVPFAAPPFAAPAPAPAPSPAGPSWTAVLERVHNADRMIGALLRSSCEVLAVEDDRLVLGFYYPFHKDKIEEPAKRRIVEEAVSAVYGRPLTLRCQLCERDLEARRRAAAEDPLVKVAVEEMGARIVEIKEGHG